MDETLMWLKQCHKPSPSHHHKYIGSINHPQSWVFYGIVLTCFNHITKNFPMDPWPVSEKVRLTPETSSHPSHTSFQKVLAGSIAGWWLTYPSEKYDFVSWDYELPN